MNTDHFRWGQLRLWKKCFLFRFLADHLYFRLTFRCYSQPVRPSVDEPERQNTNALLAWVVQQVFARSTGFGNCVENSIDGTLEFYCGPQRAPESSTSHLKIHRPGHRSFNSQMIRVEPFFAHSHIHVGLPKRHQCHGEFAIIRSWGVKSLLDNNIIYNRVPLGSWMD